MTSTVSDGALEERNQLVGRERHSCFYYG